MVQDFSNVQDPLAFILSVQPAGNMHQASRVGDDQCGRLAEFKVADLSLQPFCGEFRVFHREDPAEAAAFLALGQFHHMRTADLCQ